MVSHREQQQMRKSVPLIRQALLELISDQDEIKTKYIRLQIFTSMSIMDLWYARVAVYGLLSENHCESVANERFRGVNQHFEQFVCFREMNRHPKMK
jgi:hypothetical protein